MPFFQEIQIALKNNKSGRTEICQRLTRSYLGFEPCFEPTVASKLVFIINNYVVINSYDLCCYFPHSASNAKSQ